MNKDIFVLCIRETDNYIFEAKAENEYQIDDLIWSLQKIDDIRLASNDPFLREKRIKI